MSSVSNPQPPYDPVFLAKVHALFRTCWAEAEKFSADLDSERQSSLRRTIASRILREAQTLDDGSLVNRVLTGILPEKACGLPVTQSPRMPEPGGVGNHPDFSNH
jgi:hypothetical protein